MNEHLKAAVQRDKRKQYYIMPISNNEAEVIGELEQVFSKLNLGELAEIMANYKKFADEEVRDRLLEWNTNFEKTEEVEDENTRQIMIELQDNLYKVSAINSFELYERYDYLKERQVFEVIMNKSFSDNVPYANTTFAFNSEQLRTTFMSKIRMKLNPYGVVFL